MQTNAVSRFAAPEFSVSHTVRRSARQSLARVESRAVWKERERERETHRTAALTLALLPALLASPTRPRVLTVSSSSHLRSGALIDCALLRDASCDNDNTAYAASKLATMQRPPTGRD